jgi:hypothetical protein
MLARVARVETSVIAVMPKAAEPPLWLTNGSASGKAQKVFCYYDCYLKPPDRPRLVISSQSFVPRRLIVDVDAMTFVAAVAHGLLGVLQSRERYRVQKPACLLRVFLVAQ